MNAPTPTIRGVLEPCPFCGGSAQVADRKDPFERYVFGIECSVCPAGMTDFDELHDHGHAARQTEITAAWNRRASTFLESIPADGGTVKADSEEQIARAILPTVWQMFDEYGGRLNPSAEADRKGSLTQARRVLSCLSTHTARWTANCVRCGRVVDTREEKDGGDKFGCELARGGWTCSFECWEAEADPAPTHTAAGAGPVGEAVAGEIGRLKRENRALRSRVEQVEQALAVNQAARDEYYERMEAAEASRTGEA